MMKALRDILSNKSLITPAFYLNNVSEIMSNLKVKPMISKCKIVIFDKDDTLVPLHSFEVEDPLISQTLSYLKTEGKAVYVVSNSVRESNLFVTYKSQQSQFQIPIICTKQKKPYNGQELLSYLEKEQGEFEPNEVIIVGDRLLTDVYLGCSLGWNTILVRPIERTSMKKHGLGTYFMRNFENAFLKLNDIRAE